MTTIWPFVTFKRLWFIWRSVLLLRPTLEHVNNLRVVQRRQELHYWLSPGKISEGCRKLKYCSNLSYNYYLLAFFPSERDKRHARTASRLPSRQRKQTQRKNERNECHFHFKRSNFEFPQVSGGNNGGDSNHHHRDCNVWQYPGLCSDLCE